MTSRDSVVALHRFGYGAPIEDVELAREPRDWLAQQVAMPPTSLGTVPHSSNYIERQLQLYALPRSRREDARESLKAFAGDLYVRYLDHRLAMATDGPAPFFERLVHFWSNHFAVSRAKSGIGPSALAFELESIRPHVLGSFAEMLVAAESHPAMLTFLDNRNSVGPNSARSRDGKRRNINENLAREILELHTMGVRSGYGQDDVIELALALTGWTMGRLSSDAPGRFVFLDEYHEPGSRRFLGETYAEAGRAQGEDMLLAVARHPATASFLARKLCAHFLPQDLAVQCEESVASAYLASDGDLRATYRALLDCPQAWEGNLDRFKTPEQFVFSAIRTVREMRLGSGRLSFLLRLMGQLPGYKPSPAGWPEGREHYGGGASFRERIRTAVELTESGDFGQRAAAYFDIAFGPLSTEHTRDAITGAESPQQAAVLFLLSPEFQHR